MAYLMIWLDVANVWKLVLPLETPLFELESLCLSSWDLV